jgi:hypothetical protein
MNAALKETEERILAGASEVLERHPRMAVRRAMDDDGLAGAICAFVLAEKENWQSDEWGVRLRELESDTRTLAEFLAAQATA